MRAGSEAFQSLIAVAVGAVVAGVVDAVVAGDEAIAAAAGFAAAAVWVWPASVDWQVQHSCSSEGGPASFVEGPQAELMRQSVRCQALQQYWRGEG